MPTVKERGLFKGLSVYVISELTLADVAPCHIFWTIVTSPSQRTPLISRKQLKHIVRRFVKAAE